MIKLSLKTNVEVGDTAILMRSTHLQNRFKIGKVVQRVKNHGFFVDWGITWVVEFPEPILVTMHDRQSNGIVVVREEKLHFATIRDRHLKRIAGPSVDLKINIDIAALA
jgi:predicted RNA-binding protein (virulence factor B family)